MTFKKRRFITGCFIFLSEFTRFGVFLSEELFTYNVVYVYVTYSTLKYSIILCHTVVCRIWKSQLTSVMCAAFKVIYCHINHLHSAILTIYLLPLPDISWLTI